MAKNRTLTEEDNELLAELGIEIESKTTARYTAREERIIAGFEEIQKFVRDHRRLPEHGEGKDIFERLYAIRLDQIRHQQDCQGLLVELDHQNLLRTDYKPDMDVISQLNDDQLLAELGLDRTEESSITELKHVRSQAEKKAADEIANRTRCDDFEKFKPFFEAVKVDLDTGFRKAIRFRKDAGFTKTTLKTGQFVIIGGQTAYIAETGEIFKAPNGEDDARLRVIYANGTESNILLRSLIRAMYKDETSRFITDANDGPLFSSESTEGDLDSGTIYVLRSFSDHPTVLKNREFVHKIGVTGGDVKKRIANAEVDPTFLMAKVEIVATYKLANINRNKLEKVIHKFLGTTKLDVETTDRFGRKIKSKEWFLVPLFIINEMVEKIRNGKISESYYDNKSVSIRQYS